MKTVAEKNRQKSDAIEAEVEWYEALPIAERIAYVKKQKPQIGNFRSVVKSQKEKYGERYYAYALDNGWRLACAATREGCEAKFKEFMERKE